MKFAILEGPINKHLNWTYHESVAQLGTNPKQF